MIDPWGSLLAGDEGKYQPNLDIVHRKLSTLFWYFANTTPYHLGRYDPSSASAKELHD